MSTFSLDIGKFARKFGIQGNAVGRKIVFDIQKDTMLASPVDTGALRSNWFVGLNSRPATVAPTLSDNGASAKTGAAIALKPFAWGDTVYMVNNLPYAHKIEFEGWSHTQAPQGMLRITVARYQAQFGRWS